MWRSMSWGKRRVTSIRNEERPGGTLYIGSRNSDQVGRIYDKAAESGQEKYAGRLWRYEVEFKGDRSKAAFSGLRRHSSQKTLAGEIQNAVWWWFSERGVPPLFDKTSDRVAYEVGATVTDTSRKLAWLSTQIRPTVLDLLEAGQHDAVFRALGLLGQDEEQA
jgi:DNA relaxase NicK